MVHSDVIFWSKIVCKRRRFLSISQNRLFTIQSSQDPVRHVLPDSGGPSLHPLTECPADLKVSWLPQESGNMRTGLLATGGPSKWSLVVTSLTYMTCGTCTERCHVRYSARRAPPIKYSGGPESAFVKFPGMEILYRF